MSSSPNPAKPNAPVEATCDFAGDAAAAELVRVLDEYLAQLKDGRAPSRQELVARHPELAAQLEACVAGLEFIHGAETAAPGKARRLGDYRIIREVGRGGMGAVFEAEQVSLGRRVALKILRFGGVSDPEAIERFKREAETVAKLHHTNIVPIFNVGSEQGVNYYAMQFIEGRSLAEVLAQKKGPLPATQVAEWGLQAAEALAHAHQRGVIHRDVKPSNLLLDRENRLWLTDFGLARRLDDVTLSITGALLGTPRYMSPEQAAAAHKRVDHRSDLFSLGATLYELLTGQPAFPGETPHDVIQRILTTEPEPPRQISSAAPRDLETVVMKCLAKEPRQRYGSAGELAADLRAFLDGRPIRARRASLVERAARWLKGQQRSFKLAASAAVLTLLVIVGLVGSWLGYDSWRQAQIRFDASTPPLVAEVFDQQDKLVRVETAPMQNAIRLPAGDYHVRVSAEGKLSESFDLTLDRGTNAAITLDSRDQLLWTPRDVERGFDVVDFGAQQGQGLVLWNEKGIGLRRHNQPLGWTRDLAAQFLPKPGEAAGFRWPWNQEHQENSGYGPFDSRPWVAPRAVDIDGKGMGDLIIAARHQGWLMAISGEEGTILWFAARGHDLAQAAPQAGNYFGSGTKSAVLGTPIFATDCNGDGVPDIIATLADIGPQSELVQDRYSARVWVEAVSGKTGETLWSHDIPRTWLDLPSGEEVPYDLRWFAGTGGGYMSGGGSSMTQRRHRTRSPSQLERTGPHGYRPASVSLQSVGGTTRLAIVAGTRLLTIDPQTGKPSSEPVSLGARPGRKCQWGDVDGDGTDDLVFLQRLTGAGPSAFSKARVVVWSPVKKRPLWAKDLDADWPSQQTWTAESPEWPLVADLCRDKKCELIVPDGGSGRRGFRGRIGDADIPWGVVAALSGETGQPLWTRRLVCMDQQINYFIEGPDLDQDGYREVYATTLEGIELRAHVDALSGKTGETLWTASHTAPRSNDTSREYYLTPPQWWHSGSDGWPQLIVQLAEGSMGEGRSSAALFSAGTGRLMHLGQRISAIRPADIDGDGTDDLLVFNAKSPRSLDRGGSIHCLRGASREKWARLEDRGYPAADFDGDGIRDLVAESPGASVTATSGATGAVLWRSQVAEVGREYHIRTAARVQSGDLDGDGTADLLGWSQTSQFRRPGTPFFAISGKTGRRLWTATEITSQILTGVVSTEAHDLDGDGKLEVLWIAALDYGYPLRDGYSSTESQLWLFVTSGQTGALRWSHPLSPQFGLSPGSSMQFSTSHVVISPSVADFDGDGTSDVLAPAILADGRTLETHAINGKDGKLLWTRPSPSDPNNTASLENWPPPTSCNLDGKGLPEVVLAEVMVHDASGLPIRPHHKVVCLRGSSGQELWSSANVAPADSWYQAAGMSKGELMRPHILRTSGKENLAAVLLPGNEGKVVVFDARGKRAERKANHATSTAGIWPCDVNGDGVDELAFFDHSLLCVAPADKLDEPLWTLPIDSSEQKRILAVLPRGPKQPPILAVARDATDNSVLGINAATGERVWTAAGLIARDSDGTTYMVPRQVSLLDGGDKSPPHVYFSYEAVSRTRQASLFQAKTGSLKQLPPAAGATAVAAVLRAPAGDDRWERSLPWMESQTPAREFVTLFMWGLTSAAFLIVLPSAFLARLVIVRRFSLKMLLALPVVAALFLSVWLIKSSTMRNYVGLLPRLELGLAFAPVVVALALGAWWLAKGQWHRVLIWLGMTFLISGVSAAVLIWIAADRSPLLPEERFDTEGWHLIWFNGAFLTCWLMMFVLPARHLITRTWTWLKKRRGAAAAGVAAANAPHLEITRAAQATNPE